MIGGSDLGGREFGWLSVVSGRCDLGRDLPNCPFLAAASLPETPIQHTIAPREPKKHKYF
jgi:hypothetical protein